MYNKGLSIKDIRSHEVVHGGDYLHEGEGESSDAYASKYLLQKKLKIFRKLS